jgi:hypothetical protein
MWFIHFFSSFFCTLEGLVNAIHEFSMEEWMKFYGQNFMYEKLNFHGTKKHEISSSALHPKYN